MKLPPFSLHSRRGVTLIELLIAVGMMVVLAALIFPVMKGVRGASGNAKCISNLRATGAMLHTLIADNNQRLVTRAGGNTLSGYYFWADHLWRRGYISPNGSATTTPDPDTISVLRCPSAPIINQAWYWYTYGLNMYDPRATLSMKGPNKDARIFELNLNRVSDPSTYLLLADSISAAGDTQFTRIGAKPTFTEGIELRHQGKAHAYFLDGHVSALDRKDAEALGIPNIYDAFKRD